MFTFLVLTWAEGFIKQTANACKRTEAHLLEDVVAAWFAWLRKAKADVWGQGCERKECWGCGWHFYCGSHALALDTTVCSAQRGSLGC